MYPPLYDLKVLEKDYHIDAAKFTEAFTQQCQNNYNLLELANFTLIRHRLNLFMSLQETFEVGLPDVYTEEV